VQAFERQGGRTWLLAWAFAIYLCLALVQSSWQYLVDMFDPTAPNPVETFVPHVDLTPQLAFVFAGHHLPVDLDQDGFIDKIKGDIACHFCPPGFGLDW
jgi:hypothetical protein